MLGGHLSRDRDKIIKRFPLSYCASEEMAENISGLKTEYRLYNISSE